MAVIAPWLKGPDVIEAASSGARAGLSGGQMIQDALLHAAQLKLQRDEMNQRAAEAASALGQSGGLRTRELNIQENQDAAANALRSAALKQQGLYQNERTKNYANAVDARTALDQARENALNNKRSFMNTGGGLFAIGPDGQPSLVPGSQKPPAPAYEKTTEIIPGTDAKPADVTSHWFRNLNPFGAHIPDTTNSVAIPATQPRKIERKVPISAADSLAAPSAVAALPSGAPAIPQSHIDYLLANPNTVKQFEQLHGAGSASQYLTQPVDYSNAPAEGGAAADLETPPDDE